MYAVIKAGGKQHKVQAGDVIEIELVHGGHDGAITFTPLLVVDDDGKSHFGKELAKAQVKGKLVGQEKGDKVKIFKYRPKRATGKKTEEAAEPELEAVPAPKGGKSGSAASAGTGAEAATSAEPATAEE
jgi:large subunit ribosomal protein L21